MPRSSSSSVRSWASVWWLMQRMRNSFGELRSENENGTYAHIFHLIFLVLASVLPCNCSHYHHHFHPLVVYCRTTSFPNTSSLSVPEVKLQVDPGNALLSSLHLILCLPLFYSAWAVTVLLMLLICCHICAWYALLNIFLGRNRHMDTFDFYMFLIHDDHFLIPPCHKQHFPSIPLWVLFSVLSKFLMRLQVSEPYIRTGRM